MSEVLKHNQDPRMRPQPDIPDNLEEAIPVLEGQLYEDLRELGENTPDPLDPLSRRIAHLIAAGRARADSEVILELHTQLEDRQPH